MHAQQAGMEWHEELDTLAINAGLKGKKLNKVSGGLWFVKCTSASDLNMAF